MWNIHEEKGITYLKLFGKEPPQICTMTWLKNLVKRAHSLLFAPRNLYSVSAYSLYFTSPPLSVSAEKVINLGTLVVKWSQHGKVLSEWEKTINKKSKSELRTKFCYNDVEGYKDSKP